MLGEPRPRPHKHPSCLALDLCYPVYVLSEPGLAKTFIMSGVAGCAPSDSYQPSTNPPRRRARRSRRPIHHTPAPSSSLLSLLATVVASLPAVDASPIPLSFLCPRYRQDFAAVEETCSRDVSDSSTVPSVPVRKQFGSRTIPIQYAKGSDGQWRRVDTYTLYGSTMCPVSSAASYNLIVSSDSP